MKKNFLSSLLLLVLVSIGVSSCSDDDKPENETKFYYGKADEIVPNSNYGAYILNSGAMGSNSANMRYLDIQNNRMATDVFEGINGKGLGDTGQSMVVYGNKMYIGVYNSGVIYVTDKNAHILKTIQGDKGNKLQPRAFETYNGKVYVTLFDGYLARIDTASMTIDKKIAVGPNPEAVKVAKNKLYVANSGGMSGYNNTVSIVDPELTEKEDLIVALNPVELQVDKNDNLYLVSRGNYKKDSPSTLQKIDASTKKVEVLKDANGKVFSIFMNGDKLYILDKKYVGDAYTPVSTIFYYDLVKDEFVDKSFVTDNTVIADISHIDFEPATGNYYVTAASGRNNGDLYVFSSQGRLKSKFDTGSAYPVGVWFVRK